MLDKIKQCSPEIIRLIKFLIVGGVGTLISLGLLTLFTEVFGFYYMISAVLSSFIGVSYNYLANNYWSFSDKKNKDMKAGYRKFIVVMILYFVVYYLLLYLFAEFIFKDFIFYFVKGYMMAAALAIIMSTIPKYLLSLLWVWKDEKR